MAITDRLTDAADKFHDGATETGAMFQMGANRHAEAVENLSDTVGIASARLERIGNRATRILSIALAAYLVGLSVKIFIDVLRNEDSE